MFLKSSVIFSILTFISRIFGFIRDLLVATFFGTGVFADALYVAFKLPNFFRNIFAEGAFSAAFVPLFSGKLSAEGEEKALLFASNIFAILTTSLIVFILLLEIFMPFVMEILAPGFENNHEKFTMTVFLTNITTPYLFFISLVTFFSCILNSIGRFAAMAASPIILNVIMILAMYFIGENQPEKAVVTAWSMTIGGVLQLIVIIYFVCKKQVFPKIMMPKLTNDTKKFFKNLGPAALGSGVTQINLWVGTIIATSIPGAVSMIYYADRLVQLPISLIGVSIGIVILPTLSRYFKSGNKKAAITTQNRALEISMLLSLPCTAVILALAEPMIYILFERGEFKPADTISTTPGLITLAIGMPAYVMNKIMIPCFFAVEDTKTPVRISIMCVIINVVGNLILIRYIGYFGITLSTAITAWVNIALLTLFARRKKIFEFDDLIKIRSLKLVLSSIFLYVFLEAVAGLSTSLLYSTSKLVSLSVFSGILLAGCLIYLYSLHITKAYTINDLKEIF